MMQVGQRVRFAQRWGTGVMVRIPYGDGTVRQFVPVMVLEAM